MSWLLRTSTLSPERGARSENCSPPPFNGFVHSGFQEWGLGKSILTSRRTAITYLYLGTLIAFKVTIRKYFWQYLLPLIFFSSFTIL